MKKKCTNLNVIIFQNVNGVILVYTSIPNAHANNTVYGSIRA